MFEIGETAEVAASSQLSDDEWELVLTRAAAGKQVYCVITNGVTIKNWSEMSLCIDRGLSCYDGLDIVSFALRWEYQELCKRSSTPG